MLPLTWTTRRPTARLWFCGASLPPDFDLAFQAHIFVAGAAWEGTPGRKPFGRTLMAWMLLSSQVARCYRQSHRASEGLHLSCCSRRSGRAEGACHPTMSCEQSRPLHPAAPRWPLLAGMPGRLSEGRQA